MNFTPEVETLSGEAAAAVEALMSPTLPPGERQRTYELCERLKESPLALQCGVYLSAGHRPSMVRYLGLQVIENTVRFRWNDLPVEEKVFVKVCHLSRFVIVKRLWILGIEDWDGGTYSQTKNVERTSSRNV